MSASASGTGQMRPLVAIISTISVYGLTAGLGFPLISLNLEARGVSETLIGANAAMLAFAMLALSPLAPALIARFGFRRLVLSALVVEALCFAALPIKFDLIYWMAIRVIMGASATVLFVAAETWVNEITSDAQRGRVIGVYVTVLSATFALGPLLIPLFGYEGWLPFLVAAGMLTLAGLPLLWASSKPQERDDPGTASLLGFIRTAPGLCGAVLLFAFIEGAALALLPVYGLRLEFSPNEAAIIVTVRASGSVCLQLAIGWLADRVDRTRLMLLCATAGLLGALALPLSSGVPVLFWTVLFFWGGLSVGVYTVAMVLLGERFKGRDLATGNAAFGVMWGLGSLAGPFAGGGAMSLFGPHGLPGVIAAATALYLVFMLTPRLAR